MSKKPVPIHSTAINIPERYQHIHPVPQQPNFAARIEGLDLAKPLTPEVKRELYQALLDFEVLLLPPQELTAQQHVDLASAFGPPAPGAFFQRKDGHPLLEVIVFDEQHPPEINVWHSDLTWLPEPPAGTVIQITELPQSGGNTSWASLSKAFDALSPGLKHYLRDLSATHTWEVSGWRDALGSAGDEALVKALRKFKPVIHPVVRPHPESGKEVLFVNENFTRRIEGVHFRESRALLEFLREWIVQPEFVYTHHWERNGIAIWDNRTTQHYASADYWPHRRVTQRVTFNAANSFPTQATTREAIAEAVAA